MAKATLNTSMNISLPVKLKKYVEKRASAGGYSTPSEYVRELIRTDELRRQQQAWLDKKLTAGLEGPGVEVTPEFWEGVRKEAKARIAKRAETNQQKHVA